jgi:hypothetical protein
MTSRRLLYAGNVNALPGLLRDALKPLDCFIVGSPLGVARTFIKSDIKYTLLLFDDDEMGAELESYTRTLEHRERTPIMFIKQPVKFRALVESIKRVVSEK